MLTPKKKLFIAEYQKDLNATQAAIRAGYSKKTAKSQGQRLLTDVDVKKSIAKKTKEKFEKLEIGAEKVLQESARIAFSDIRKVFAPNMTLKNVDEWDDNTAASISSVEIEEEFSGRGKDREQVGWTKKVKCWDKVKALELLGKHLNLFTDKVEVEIKPLLVLKSKTQ